VRHANVLSADNRKFVEERCVQVPLPSHGPIALRASLRNADLTFACRWKGAEWQPIGKVWDATKLSDDYPMESGIGWFFTGLYAALCAQDSSAARIPADFDFFRYEARA
jgi:xylan 1,4-beta-xylosidase